MNGAILPSAPCALTTSTWRTVYRPGDHVAEGPQVAFTWFDPDGQPGAYTRAYFKKPGSWTLELRVCGRWSTSGLIDLLQSTVEAVRENGGRLIETIIEFDAELPFAMLRDSGLTPVSLLSYGGEAAAVFAISDVNEHRVSANPGPK